jgi:hypothetical protein
MFEEYFINSDKKRFMPQFCAQ